MKCILAVLCLCLVGNPAPCRADDKKDAEQKKAPVETADSVLLGFQGYPRFGGTSSLSMECHRADSPSTITCDFTWLGIRLKETDSDQKLAEAKTGLEAAPEAELRKSFGDLQNSRDEQRREEQALSAQEPRKFSPEQLQNAERHLSLIRNVPRCTDKPCMIAAMLRIFDFDRHTCLVWTDRFALTFQQTASNKWVSTQGPGNLCHIVRVSTLESEPGDAFLWTFTQTVASRDKESGCESIELNKSIVYSWNAPRKFDLDCHAFEWSQHGFLPSDLLLPGAGDTVGW